VIGAFRDAAKLVQRLKIKAQTSEEFLLPEDLTKDFENSLQLGCSAVQSQYDHDVRRFGETYSRGDSVAREQMKDILIHLQQAVITHLREVFMDEAALDLHMLKETSDDCRVNATVCLGQLYQRMSTATAAMKQISRPSASEPDRVQLPISLTYSSSHSTHSSTGGRPYDLQSSTSYTTYSSRTATGQDRKTFDSVAPQRRVSMTSARSYSSEVPAVRTPGEDNVPALPLSPEGRLDQGTASLPSVSAVSSPLLHTRSQSNVSGPPPYQPDLSRPVYTTDDKGQNFPPESTLYQPPSIGSPRSMVPNISPLPSPRLPAEVNTALSTTAAPSPGLESKFPVDALADEKECVMPAMVLQSPPSRPRQAVPLNPDYSTLEHVAAPEPRRRVPPPAPIPTIPENQYQQFLQQLPPHLQQQVQETMLATKPSQATLQGYREMASPVSRPQTRAGDSATYPATIDPMTPFKVSSH
jgi:hypothetical protein